jgi:hypothetical protein
MVRLVLYSALNSIGKRDLLKKIAAEGGKSAANSDKSGKAVGCRRHRHLCRTVYCILI